jgi:hypothetical protein
MMVLRFENPELDKEIIENERSEKLRRKIEVEEKWDEIRY